MKKLSLLTKDGKPNYTVVVKNGIRTFYEKSAQEELTGLLYELTNVHFPVAVDGVDEIQGNVISLGQTSFATKHNVVADKTQLGVSGYVIATCGSDVVICGCAPAVLFGVYAFFRQAFGYEFFADDEVYFAQADKCYSFDGVNLTEKPDFEYPYISCCYMATMAHPKRYKMVHPWMLAECGWGCHNTLMFLPPDKYRKDHPDWYATDVDGNELEQLNFNKGDEFIDIVFDKITEFLTESYKPQNYREEWTHLSFFQEDYTDWDQSQQTLHDYCTHSGSNAVALVRFVNKLADKLQAWIDVNQTGREVYLSFFAYEPTVTPPVKYGNDFNVTVEDGKVVVPDETMYLRPNVVARVAPIHANWYVALNDAENKKVRNEIKGWTALGKTNYWLYSTSFHTNYANFFNFDSLQATYRYIHSLGTNHLYDQIASCGSTSPCFSDYRLYLQSNLLWNVNANVDELTDKFFANYYKDCAQIMRKYLEEVKQNYRDKWRSIGLDGECNWVDLYVKELWAKQDLLRWLGNFDNCFAIIDKYKPNVTLYDKLYKRINTERVGIKFLYLHLYGTDLDEQEYVKQATQVYEDLKKYNMLSRCGYSIEDIKHNELRLKD